MLKTIFALLLMIFTGNIFAQEAYDWRIYSNKRISLQSTLMVYPSGQDLMAVLIVLPSRILHLLSLQKRQV
jgi:hypothetical protein